MKIDNKSFSEEYSQITSQIRAIENNKKAWPYTSNPDWLWLDGRRTAMEWIMKMAD